MRLKGTIFGSALSVCLICTPAYAGTHGRPPVSTPHSQAPKTTGKPITTGKSITTQKSMTTGKPSATGKPTTTGTHSGTARTTGSTSTKSRTTSTSPSTSGSAPLNPIATKISSKPQLNARISAMLPKDTTLDQASKGFKNQGQFIAALHASQNLGCDCFKQLQTDMTAKNMSLGQAIQDVKKTANATVEAQRAESEANDDVRRTTTTTTASSRPSGKKDKEKSAHGSRD
jgi:hypothetical protein